MSKTFVHTHCAVVKDNVLLCAVDLRRRDVDAETAFAYYVKQQKSYSSVDASETALDITFFHSSDASNQTFTRLKVFDAETCCERCAAERGAAHESYCDAEKKVVVAASDAKASSAQSVLSKLKLSVAQSSSSKAVESAAAESAQQQTPNSSESSESAQQQTPSASESSESDAKAKAAAAAADMKAQHDAKAAAASKKK